MQVIDGYIGYTLYAPIHREVDTVKSRFYLQPQWAAFFGDIGWVVGVFRLTRNVRILKFAGTPDELAEALDAEGVPRVAGGAVVPRVCMYTGDDVKAIYYEHDVERGTYYDYVDFCPGQWPGPLARRLDEVTGDSMNQYALTTIMDVLQTAPEPPMEALSQLHALREREWWGGTVYAQWAMRQTAEIVSGEDVKDAWKKSVRRDELKSYKKALALYMRFMRQSYDLPEILPSRLAPRRNLFGLGRRIN